MIDGKGLIIGDDDLISGYFGYDKKLSHKVYMRALKEKVVGRDKGHSLPAYP